MTIGRNDPCSCGSGKKYKKCCMAKDMEVLDRDRQAANTKIEAASTKRGMPIKNSPYFFSDVDILSNSVMDLIRSKDFEKAKKGCQKLLDDFPDQVDGLERYAYAYEAEGDRPKAAEYFRKAAEFMRNNPGFDNETIDDYSKRARDLEAGGPDK